MLLDIPAVAATEGAVTNVTWRSDNLYTYTGVMFIPGAFTSGTFTNGENAEQEVTGATSVVSGNQSSGTYLKVTSVGGAVDASPSRRWIGESSGAIFTPSGVPYLPPILSVYIDPPSDAAAYVLRRAGVEFNYNGSAAATLSLARNPVYGSTIKWLVSVAPTFSIPAWARSGTVRNISGAEMHIRHYRPNLEGNVIDTTATTFGETGIVGQLVKDGGIYSFDPGGFTPGTSWMLCADAAATGGAIAEFNP